MPHWPPAQGPAGAGKQDVCIQATSEIGSFEVFSENTTETQT